MKIDSNPDRVRVVQGNLERYLETAPAPSPAAGGRRRLGRDEPLREGTELTAGAAVDLFADQAASRAVDVVARELKREGLGFYTISSAGHEQNAVVGALLRRDDPCFLHYRSGAFMMARARGVEGETPVLDALLGLTASADDPISEGRHKVFGSKRLWVLPQTSTIASHLPKAVGMAFALPRARRIGLELPVPGDAIVCCSFGDASASHASALTALNAARYAYRGGRPTPILFVCEDNRIGVSVDTPSEWIRERFATMASLAYFNATGPLDNVWNVTREAIRTCRLKHCPVFLHLDCVRLWGHAGSDVETTYRTWEEINSIESGDPLLGNARLLVETGAAEPSELLEILSAARERAVAAGREAVSRPKLTRRAAVVAPLAPYDEERVRAEAARPAATDEERERVFGGTLPEHVTSATRRTLAAQINAALTDELLRRPEILVFGEDVGKKGGVYGLTSNLQRRFGAARVFDTLLDETTILGIAQGAAFAGLLPIPEIQYLAYLHNAIDQLRGEACSTSFFSAGQYTNPMVVRIAGYGYQKGFGGHFHNDNSIGALREIPGLLLASPSRGDDAARMLRGCLAAARACGRVAVFLEPIALYHERDLFEPGDGAWLTEYPPPGRGADSVLLPGEVGVYEPDADELLIVSYANGLRLALRAAARLREEAGLHARVADVRWLNPLPHEAIAEHARACGAVLVVDECRATGAGIADAVIARLAEDGHPGPVASVRSADTYVPLGAAMGLVLVSEDEIVAAALRLAGR